MAARNARIHQDVTDISDADQLLRFAAAGQLEPLLVRRGISQGKIAQGAGLGGNDRSAGPVLTKALGSHLSPRQLRGLDEIIGALAPDLDGRGGLSSLALRLYPDRGRARVEEPILAARVPPGWTSRILKDTPVSEVGVLMQASALLSELMSADRMKAASFPAGICERYQAEIDLLVKRLIFISVAPPTAQNYDAQILLGMLASYAFEYMREPLENKLRYSPMSFRVWRAITKLVILGQDGPHANELRAWVRDLVCDAEDLRESSLYAGRSLDLELAITVPAAWSPPDDDWVGNALLVRARDPKATIRERGTAAMGLCERALDQGGDGADRTIGHLRELIAEFRDPTSRPDAHAGLRWVAATVEQAVETGNPIGNDWPDVDEPWFGHVQAAARGLADTGIPAHLLTGTQNLFRHMILQNAGVYRRQALETIVASGLTRPVARALATVLQQEKDQAWLRVRAEFALGFLQQPDARTETVLTEACEHAYRTLMADGDDPQRAHITELHAALFAAGDCFGVPGAQELASNTRSRLRPILEDLAGTGGERAVVLRRPARAAAYLLTATAQPTGHGTAGHQAGPDLSHELLQKLEQHPDEVTAKLSHWALSFRFGSEGEIRPFMAAADHGARDDSPHWDRNPPV
jgi:hypothetical protein